MVGLGEVVVVEVKPPAAQMAEAEALMEQTMVGLGKEQQQKNLEVRPVPYILVVVVGIWDILVALAVVGKDLQVVMVAVTEQRT